MSTSATARIIYRGSIEYLEVTVSADVELADQPVRISFDRPADPDDWLTCEWVGDVGETRTAQVLVNDANLPTHSTPVFVKVTDNPEVPIVRAGFVHRA